MKIAFQVIFIFFLGIFMSQIPTFGQIYNQTLPIELERLDVELQEIDLLASARSINRYDYVNGLLTTNDPAILEQGIIYLEKLSRRQNLVNAISVFSKSEGGDSMILLMFYSDWETFFETTLNFMPKFELSVIFFGYLFSGMGIAFFLVVLPSMFRVRYIPVPAEARMDDTAEEEQLEALLGGNRANRN